MYKANINEKQGYCLICFSSLFEKSSLSSLLALNDKVCDSCLSKFKKINKTQIILGVQTTFLYEYNSMMKKLIYQYKGCYDILLKDVFLLQHKFYINRRFKDYTVIFPPSNEYENEKRGYNHIKEIVKTLNLKYQEADESFTIKLSTDSTEESEKKASSKISVLVSVTTEGETVELGADVEFNVEIGGKVNGIDTNGAVNYEDLTETDFEEMENNLIKALEGTALYDLLFAYNKPDYDYDYDYNDEYDYDYDYSDEDI